jgi:adenylyltransferase/sulfurtransferase
MADALPFEISVEELHRRRAAGEDLFILDVRQPDEHAVCNLKDAVLLPLGELPLRLEELDPQREIVVHCKMGGRSLQAVAFLRNQGFAKARNLRGGILAWADQFDPGMTRY